MRIAFRATEARFDVDEYALVCGVRGGEEQYLIFQRGPEGSTEDWGVYLEYGDQINGGYRCVGQCRLGPEHLSVDLAGQLGSLGGVDGFDVELVLDDESYEQLRTGLRRIFRGQPEALLVA